MRWLLWRRILTFPWKTHSHTHTRSTYIVNKHKWEGLVLFYCDACILNLTYSIHNTRFQYSFSPFYASSTFFLLHPFHFPSTCLCLLSIRLTPPLYVCDYKYKNINFPFLHLHFATVVTFTSFCYYSHSFAMVFFPPLIQFSLHYFHCFLWNVNFIISIECECEYVKWNHSLPLVSRFVKLTFCTYECVLV
jgi:hypothetical protein